MNPFQEMASDLLVEFGDVNATYTKAGENAVPCACILTIDDQLQGDDLQTIVRADTVEYKTNVGIKPRRGDVFAINGQNYTVESTVSRDDVWTKMVVK